jgi:hypothetical protein
MSGPQTREKFPTRKISATFLDFAEPLLGPLGPKASEQEMEGALQIAFTVWNSVVYDAAQGGNRWVSQVRSLAAEAPDPGVLLLVEHMIARKRSLFGDDQRLIGQYKFVRRRGELRLRAEAKSPSR